MEKRGLAGATGDHDGEKLALWYVEGDVIDGGDGLWPVAVEDLAEVFDADVRFQDKNKDGKRL